MSFTRAPISAVITDATGNTINLGNASGAFTAAPVSIVFTDANGNTLNVGAGVVAVADATAQQANIVSTTLYAVPTTGMYRISFYVVVTQAATVSGTMPNGDVQYTDADSGVVQNLAVSSTAGNTLGANSAGAGPLSSGVFKAKGGTNISYSTSAYASSGATPLQYAIHVKLEYLGA